MTFTPTESHTLKDSNIIKENIHPSASASDLLIKESKKSIINQEINFKCLKHQ